MGNSRDRPGDILTVMPETKKSFVERLFAEHHSALQAFFYRRLKTKHDAADLVQEVLVLLMQKLPEFDYDPSQSFRGWLRTVTLNKWRDIRRLRRIAVTEADAAAMPAGEDADAAKVFEEADYRQHVVKQALAVMQAEFQPATWKACWEYMIDGKPAEAVAKELGLTVNAVYLAKSRVLSRLREELAGLLD
jgi:RNA polymerase sigma-70 factor (ECF subfamily)